MKNGHFIVPASRRILPRTHWGEDVCSERHLFATNLGTAKTITLQDKNAPNSLWKLLGRRAEKFHCDKSLVAVFSDLKQIRFGRRLNISSSALA